MADEYAKRMTLLCGFEAEVVPAASYRQRMPDDRERYGFDYMVGSVHYVSEIQIDGERADFDRAVEAAGGLEAFAVRYYETVAEMIEALRPDVVGHLDLIRKNAPKEADLATPRIRQAVDRALEAAREAGAVLDLNTAGWRTGLATPYPAPWLVRRACETEVAFCFGDDSHGPRQTGAGVVEARAYLLENGVESIRRLTREDGRPVWQTVDL